VADKIVEAAVAVVVRPDGSYLLAQRPPGKAYAGYWEFPGGKIEPGETARAALAREMREELNIEPIVVYPWLTRAYVYPHASVKLHFFRVTEWQGELHGREGQQLAWQHGGHDATLGVEPMLPANSPILRALALPAVYGISHAAELGAEVFLQRLELALQRGLRLVQLREKTLPQVELLELAQRVVALCRRHGARVLVNGDVELARSAGADGVHFAAAQLMACAQHPDLALCGASCHNAAELRHAETLGFDFAVLGAVQPTPSHPGIAGMGWQAFRDATRDSTIPVYALGGMRMDDLETAWRHGAHGIATMRAVWPDG
jgi:8-oxo-dGTP diphosphatase